MRTLLVRPFILPSSASLQLRYLSFPLKWKIDTEKWDSPSTHTYLHILISMNTTLFLFFLYRQISETTLY